MHALEVALVESAVLRKKYPDPTGFDKFLGESGGGSNAYTDQEATATGLMVSCGWLSACSEN